MVQRYRPDELEMIGMHPESDGDYVDYEDYAALEQRVKELNELGRLLKEAKTKIAELEAALDLANKRLKSKADPLSQALNEGDGVYRP